jgi:hypothetical protein
MRGFIAAFSCKRGTKALQESSLIVYRAWGTAPSFRFFSFSLLGEIPMHLTINHLQPIVALLAGVLILIMPRLLNFIVAIYLIFIGIVGLGLIH